jgi:hypothetical protein
MKNMLKILFALATLVSPSLIQAENLDVEIHCVPRKAGEKMNPGSGPGGKSVAKENWVYDVTIENKTFNDLANLELKYVIFFNQEHLGKKEGPKAMRQTGSVTLPLLRSHEKKSFTTDGVELTKAHLIGEYHYPSGAKPNAQGTLTGLWVRVYQGGQQFAEYANPSTLMREKWE